MRHYDVELKALAELSYWLHSFHDYKSYSESHAESTYSCISGWLFDAIPADVLELLNSGSEASFNLLKGRLKSAREKYEAKEDRGTVPAS